MSSPPEPTNPSSPYAVLRNPNLVRYLLGRFIATSGQQMFIMAVGWEIFERTHSALALGLVGLTMIVPMYLLTLPAGHYADNHSRKNMIIVAVVIIAVANVGLAAISKLQAAVPLIYLCLFTASAARTFMGAAMASFLPQLVERRDFSRAVTWNSGFFQLSAILGPILAGIIISAFQHQAWPVYGLNALAALTFCSLLATIDVKTATLVKQKLNFQNLLTGFRFVFSTRIILGIITLDMLAVLLGGSTALLPVFAKEILHVGPRDLGILQSALPLGAVLCSIYLAHQPPLRKAGRSLFLAVAWFGLATIGFGLSKWFWFSFALLLSCGLADNVSVVVRHTVVQMLTPDEKRGRVSAVNNLFIGTSNELGEFESGSVAHLLGPAIGNTIAVGAMLSVVVGGVGTIIAVAAVAMAWPGIRRIDRLDQL